MEAKKLFQGSFGVVKVKDGKAVKRAINENDLSLNREFIAYTRMKEGMNTCIARLIEYAICDKVVELIYEDAGMALNQWIESEYFFDPIHVLLHPLLSGLQFLQERGIAHTDIHPRNLCLYQYGDGELIAKYIDFGCSVVVKDVEEWPCHGSSGTEGNASNIRTRIDPRTKLHSDQSSPPSIEMDEVELTRMYNVHLFRDPLALIATAVTHEDVIPRGLTLGNADDVYGLGMCVVRMLTMFNCVPWREWQLLNTLKKERLFVQKRKILCEILQRNPAWDPRFFQNLHMRFRPVSSRPEDSKKMEASSRAMEIHLHGLSTLYPNFFVHLTEMYDEGASDLLRGCVHPDRHRRFPHTVSEVDVSRRKMARPRRWLPFRKTDVRVKTSRRTHIHVSFVHCWIMTGIVRSGKLVWWNAAMGMMTRVKRGHKASVVRCALKRFILKVRELDSSLNVLPCTDWPFAFESQGKMWLKALELYDLARPSQRVDKAPYLGPRSTDKNAPKE